MLHHINKELSQKLKIWPRSLEKNKWKRVRHNRRKACIQMIQLFIYLFYSEDEKCFIPCYKALKQLNYKFSLAVVFYTFIYLLKLFYWHIKNGIVHFMIYNNSKTLPGKSPRCDSWNLNTEILLYIPLYIIYCYLEVILQL